MIVPRRFGDERGYFIGDLQRSRFRCARYRRRLSSRTINPFQRPPERCAACTSRVHPQRKPSSCGCCAARFSTWRWTSGAARQPMGAGAAPSSVPRGPSNSSSRRASLTDSVRLESDTEVAYKVDAYYSPECESGVLWNDPALGIDWPIDRAVAMLSDKDRKLPPFRSSPRPSPSRLPGYDPHAQTHSRDRRRRLHRLCRGARTHPRDATRGGRPRQADLCRQPRQSRAGGEGPSLPLRAEPTSSTRRKMREVVRSFRPDVIMHLAAESHVDRSIDGPAQFIQTNVVGTFSLLQAALEHWRSLSGAARDAFRFHHVSTDEVFGSLGPDGSFTETTPYQPNSPYSASKAASDHLVRAWHHTYGLPVVLSNCSNNYGPYHFPEKLIPLIDSQRARRQAAAGLWQGRERPRLALCRGPRACPPHHRGERAGSARATTSAATTRRPTLRSFA